MKLQLTTTAVALTFALTLAAGIALGISSPASAQAGACGPLSRWTGTVCMGPRGKAYCPAGMTMENQTCVLNASNVPAAVQPAAAQPLVGAKMADESEHQLIIRMLTNLTNQVAAQQAQIAQVQDTLKVLQINLNLATMDADKAKVAADNAEGAIASVQQADASTAASIATLQSSMTSLNTGITQANNALSTQAFTLNTQTTNMHDMARRLYATCYMTATLYAPSATGDVLCAVKGWGPSMIGLFNTPFG